MIDYSISKETQTQLKSLATAIKEKVGPVAEDLESGKTTVGKSLSVLKELGLLGPEQLAGSGFTPVLSQTFTDALVAAVSPALAAGIFCSSRVVAPILPEADRNRLYAGEGIGTCAVAEPQSGTDPSSFTTTAKKDGNGFRITGEKAWVSLAGEATDFLVLAKLEDEGQFGFFHIKAGASGLKIQPAGQMMGLRGLNLGSLLLEGVQVEEAVLLRKGTLPEVLKEPLARQRVGLGVISRGIILACMEDAMTHSMGRANGGKKLAHQQLVHFRIAEFRTHHDAVEMVTRRAAWCIDRGDLSDPCIPVSRVYGAECAVESAHRALQIHGAAGLIEGHPAERRYRDSRLLLLMGRPVELERCDMGKADLALMSKG